MVRFGFGLSSEEHGPTALVRQAALAEEAGFDCLSISDHFHPWIPAQGNSPFVWSVLGGIATSTSSIPVMTGVTCPIMRIHPAIIAQAAGTAAVMFQGRFTLGLGTGEALNEHVLGHAWPPPAVRQDMLGEAIAVMKRLWSGDEVNFQGAFFNVRSARLFTLPVSPIPLVIAAAGEGSARIGAAHDGLMTTSPDANLVRVFEEAGGAGKPTYAHITLGWARDRDAAARLVAERWPTSALPGPMHADIPTPALFEQTVSLVDKDRLANASPHGSRPEDFLPALRDYVEAGFSHIVLHPVGPDIEGFLDFWRDELRPAVASL